MALAHAPRNPNHHHYLQVCLAVARDSYYQTAVQEEVPEISGTIGRNYLHKTIQLKYIHELLLCHHNVGEMDIVMCLQQRL